MTPFRVYIRCREIANLILECCIDNLDRHEKAEWELTLQQLLDRIETYPSCEGLWGVLWGEYSSAIERFPVYADVKSLGILISLRSPVDLGNIKWANLKLEIDLERVGFIYGNVATFGISQKPESKNPRPLRLTTGAVGVADAKDTCSSSQGLDRGY